MLLEHGHYCGLGMDAGNIVCSWSTNGIMVWARMFWSSYAFGTRTLLWFGHGCSGHRMLLEHERYYGLGMDALVIVCSWNMNVIMVWAWMLWSSYALGTRAELWFGHGCSGHRMLCGRLHIAATRFPCAPILLELPNAGSTRLRPTKNKSKPQTLNLIQNPNPNPLNPKTPNPKH